VETRLIWRLAVVSFTYGVASFLLYRARVLGDSVADSDAVVLYGPAIAAVAGNACIFWRALGGRSSTGFRFVSALGLAALLTFVAMWCWMFIAFNRYGT
jgi:hypothetical protein